MPAAHSTVGTPYVGTRDKRAKDCWDSSGLFQKRGDRGNNGAVSGPSSHEVASPMYQGASQAGRGISNGSLIHLERERRQVDVKVSRFRMSESCQMLHY